MDFYLATYDTFEPWWATASFAVSFFVIIGAVIALVLSLPPIRARLGQPRRSAFLWHVLAIVLVLAFLVSGLVFHFAVRLPAIAEYEQRNPSSANGPITIRGAAESYVRSQVVWAIAAIALSAVAAAFVRPSTA